MGLIRNGVIALGLAGMVLAGVSGCKSGGSSGSAAGSPSGTAASSGAGASTSASSSPSPTRPSGPPLQLDSITPATGSTVGVAMPISIVFTNPVATSARAAVEQHLKVSASAPVLGAWHWFSSRRVDWRPQKFWSPNTKVTVDAALTDVGDGNGRYGTHDYTHSFTVGSDLETKIDVPSHSMKVYSDGVLKHSYPIDAGNPKFPTWDGTMAVLDKAASVHMTSCSVHITCDRANPNFYDLTLPWDVHLTFSGTYVHYSTGDPVPGHGYGSHGCVHLSLANAKAYYGMVKQGDPVTITGSPRGNAAGDNGYAAFNLSWTQWLAASATGAQTTTAQA
ncbi:L,D-transpeptidase [Streptacidiphilus cavernicola]|uniref:Ig-like domain-containing protein n=1 Tax=Streptacidiphilus cavernicola TaxID=3342716 RepID=A0ABV6VPY6_9ACTN